MLTHCKECGDPLQLLFTSWFCAFCEQEENRHKTKSFAYIVVDMTWVDDNPHLLIPPKTPIYLYLTREGAEEIADMLNNHKTGIINITHEKGINWDYKEGNCYHVTTRHIPLEILD